MNPNMTHISNKFIAVDPKNTPYNLDALCNVLYENTDKITNQEATESNKLSSNKLMEQKNNNENTKTKI